MKELKEKIAREKEELEKKEEMERATYSDNNFWRSGSSLEDEFDIDELMKDFD
jgi:hypothetical protein